jgi:lipoate-protein ligase A
MSYDMDGQKMTEVLRIGREKISDKGITSAAKRVDPLRSQTGLSRSEIIDQLKLTFTSLYGATEGDITDAEYAEAEKLVAEKFATEEWLYRVP